MVLFMIKLPHIPDEYVRQNKNNKNHPLHMEITGYVISKVIFTLLLLGFIAWNWKKMSRDEKIAVLTLPLVSALAVFSDDWVVNTILGVGLVALFIANAFSEEMFDLANRHSAELCLGFTVLLLVGSLLVEYKSFEGALLAVSTFGFLMFTMKLYIRRFSKNHPSGQLPIPKFGPGG